MMKQSASPTMLERVDALLDAAIDLHQQFKLEQAEALYRQLLQLQPNNVDALQLLGLLAHQVGQHEVAINLINSAILYDPKHAEAYNNLGLSKQAIGKIEEARAHFLKAISLDPKMVTAINNYASLLHLQDKDLNKAIVYYKKALAIDPQFSMAQFNLGNAYNALNQFALAKSHYHKALAISPNNAQVHYALGSLDLDEGNLKNAIQHFRHAIAFEPNFALAHHALAISMQRICEIDEAIANYQKAFELNPEKCDAFQGKFLAMQYSTHFTESMIAQCCKEFSERYETPLIPEWGNYKNILTTKRRLKIGYVSADLRAHPVANFILPVIKNHDSALVEVYCYYNNDHQDQVTDLFKSHVQHWFNVSSLTDEALAKQIREDEIDILFDLAGHTHGNRLMTFARKPAPIQISWMGYLGSTGLSAIDYRISDSILEPIGATNNQTPESPLHMNKLWYVYQPCIKSVDLISAPEMQVTPTPALQNGYITLGSFNNVSKFNASVTSLWANILKAMPTAKLAIVAEENELSREKVWQSFSSAGVNKDQILFLDYAKDNHYLLYRQIDIMLDPFPYNGGTTTCDAIWMGVPFITLEGESVRARMGTTIAYHINHVEWIAKTREEYLEKVIHLANDVEALNLLRLKLRDNLLKSPLLDAVGFTQDFEKALCTIWANYCKQHAQTNIT